MTKKEELIQLLLSMEFAFSEDMTLEERKILKLQRVAFTEWMGWDQLSEEELEQQANFYGLTLSK